MVERTPVHTNAHGLFVFERHVDDGAELFVLLVLEANVAGIDAVLVECFRAIGIVAKKRVADVMEIADQWDRHAEFAQLITDSRHSFSGFITINRDAHEFGPGTGEIGHLFDGSRNVGRVRVGHRLHHDRRPAADNDAADIDSDRRVPGFETETLTCCHF